MIANIFCNFKSNLKKASTDIIKQFTSCNFKGKLKKHLLMIANSSLLSILKINLTKTSTDVIKEFASCNFKGKLKKLHL